MVVCKECASMEYLRAWKLVVGFRMSVVGCRFPNFGLSRIATGIWSVGWAVICCHKCPNVLALMPSPLRSQHPPICFGMEGGRKARGLKRSELLAAVLASGTLSAEAECNESASGLAGSRATHQPYPILSHLSWPIICHDTLSSWRQTGLAS